MNPLSRCSRARRFSVAEYHKMINDDLLTSDDHVELLDGYILYKSDYGPFSGSLAFPEWSDLRKFTPAEYHRLVELGILLPDERVELLDGYVVKKMPHNPPHDSVVQRLTSASFGRFRTGGGCDANFRSPSPEAYRSPISWRPAVTTGPSTTTTRGRRRSDS